MSLQNFVRVHDAALSLWQSVVSEFVRQQSGPITHKELLKHPMIAATARHVQLIKQNNPPRPSLLDLTHPQHQLIYLSHLACQQAINLVEGNTEKAAALETEYRKYSNKDIEGFAQCVPIYEYYHSLYDGHYAYNDWKDLGEDISTYSVINAKGFALPNDAKVAILGDWGTGLPDAEALLVDIIVNHQPAAIIHLGDIYYAGTPNECIDHFAVIFKNAFATAGVAPIPVFTIPGNHDYYSLGWGYYQMVKYLNSAIGNTALQDASYFCLRTEDNGWQFLGMDSGIGDSSPLNMVDAYYAGPQLQPNEIEWHIDKLENFTGNTILLSHHQLFSNNNKINGELSAYSALPELNPYLFQAFSLYFNRISAWLWGHEHNFVMFQNELLGLEKGRLLGCSAYEQLMDANPYELKYPAIKNFVDPTTNEYVQLGTNTDSNGVGYYNHGYAIIDFSTRLSPTDDVVATYYQFPSWGDEVPTSPAASVLYSENYSTPQAATGAVLYNTDIIIQSVDGLYIGAINNGYPEMTLGQGVSLQVVAANGNSSQLYSGATVRIMTTEPNMGAKKYLGGDSFSARLFYTHEDDSTNLWTVYKVDTIDSQNIFYTDAVYFVNQKWDQWLKMYDSVMLGGLYLTTATDANAYFMITPAIMKLPAVSTAPLKKKYLPFKTGL